MGLKTVSGVLIRRWWHYTHKRMRSRVSDVAVEIGGMCMTYTVVRRTRWERVLS